MLLDFILATHEKLANQGDLRQASAALSQMYLLRFQNIAPSPCQWKSLAKARRPFHGIDLVSRVRNVRRFRLRHDIPSTLQSR